MNRYITRFILPSNEEYNDKIERQPSKYSFVHYTFYDDSKRYPLGLFPTGLELEFSPVTILYGNNGSGKSTILNLMAEALEIGRRSPINNSPFFSLFAKFCQISTHSDFDNVERRRDIITSDDVFKHCFQVRDSNRESYKHQNDIIQEKVSKIGKEVASLRGLDDFDRWKRDISMQRKTFSENLRKYSRHFLKLASNGETALDFFTSTINSAGVYLLDEPENSLSPSFQLRLVDFLEKTSEWMGMQYIIATHSPLVLGMSNAKIINLDEEGAPERKWSELENIRILHDFFSERENDFK